MNFLQICQFAQRYCGGGNELPGTAPTTVTGQSGYLYELVQHVKDVYQDILNEQDQWTFTQRQANLYLPQGMNVISPQGMFRITLTGEANSASFPVGQTVTVTAAVSGPAGPYSGDFDMTVMAVTSDVPNDRFTIDVNFNSPEAVAAQPAALPVGASVATLATSIGSANTYQTVGYTNEISTTDGSIDDYLRLSPFVRGPGYRLGQLWRVSVGPQDKGDCFYVPYQEYRGTIDLSPYSVGKAWRFTVRPEGALEFDTFASEPMGFAVDYQFAAPPLVNDADIPVLPERFHAAIGWGAALYWAKTQGNAQKTAVFLRDYNRVMNDMRSRCLPEVLPYISQFI